MWTKEGSDFQGPLDISVTVDEQGRLPLSASGQRTGLELRANGSLPVVVVLAGDGTLPVEAAFDGESAAPLGNLSRTLEAGQRKRLTFELPIETAGTLETSVLTLRGGGMFIQLPATLSEIVAE